MLHLTSFICVKQTPSPVEFILTNEHILHHTLVYEDTITLCESQRTQKQNGNDVFCEGCLQVHCSSQLMGIKPRQALVCPALLWFKWQRKPPKGNKYTIRIKLELLLCLSIINFHTFVLQHVYYCATFLSVQGVSSTVTQGLLSADPGTAAPGWQRTALPWPRITPPP